MKETQQCSKCNKYKPLDEYYNNRTACKPCETKQRVEINKKARERKRTGKQENKEEEEKQEQTFSIAEVEEILLNTLDSADTNIDFGNREDVEKFIADDLIKDIVTLDKLSLLYEGLSNSATNKKERKEYAAKLETNTAKKIDLKLKLIKNFNLFAELEKPENEDPLYTPVLINVVTKIPDSQIVDQKFQPEEDEIQDFSNESNT